MFVTLKPAFLFDLDGTLADTLPDITATTNHVRQLHGLTPVDEKTVRSYIGDGAKALIRRALRELESDRELTEEFVATTFAAYVDHHRDQCTVHAQLYPGAREHLQQLRADGHPIAVVTNKPERFAVPLVQHLGLDAFTSVVVGGDTLPTKKPDPAMLVHALQQLHVDAPNATMVGDGLQDVAAGKALNLRTIGCLFGYGKQDALRAAGPDVLWSAFAVAE